MTDFDFSNTPMLETERLKLRRILRNDRDDWFAVLTSPGVLDYLTDFDHAPPEEVMDEIVDWSERVFAEKSGIRWAITRKPSDQMIGSCGFHHYNRRDRRLEIGYELHSAYWRQGIMTEAVNAVCRFCFDALRVHRIEADVTEGNVASAALLNKLGFTLEGVWRERVRWRGGFQSMWQFGLLAPEFEAAR